nr:unnamed protein product [Callosobruchus analis]
MENEEAAVTMDEFLCNFMLQAKDLTIFYKITAKEGEMVFEVRLHLSEDGPVSESSYCSIIYVLPDIAKQAFKRLNGTSFNDRIVVTKMAEGMRLELRTVVSRMDVDDDLSDLMTSFNSCSLSTTQENVMEDPITFDEPNNINIDSEDPQFSPVIFPVQYTYMLDDCDPSYLWQTHVYGHTLPTEAVGRDDVYMLYPGGITVFPNAPWSKSQNPSMKWTLSTSFEMECTSKSLGTKISAKNPFLMQKYNLGQLPFAVPDAKYLQNWVFGDPTQWRHHSSCGACGFLMGEYF